MKYCAFLRGVNVNGTAMKMAEVCDVFKKAGMKDVSSVLATGNILFKSDEAPEILKQKLEKSLSEHFQYEAFLFLKTDEEVKRILDNSPFEKNENLHIYSFICNAGDENLLMQEFLKTNHQEQEEAQLINGNFYWKIPKGNTLGSEFGKILGKKSFKNILTSRNINTIEKIVNKFFIL
jgi:uncharacterized protein (DUF1697 family)